MDDNLDPVTQEFIADVTEYVAEVGRAAEEGRKFAGSAEEAKVAVDGMRDKVTEAAAALGICRDEMGKLRNASGEVITATEAESMALKHLRDRALEAAWAQRDLADVQKKGLLSRIGGGIGGLFGGGGSGSGGGGAAGLGSLAPGLGSLTGIISMIAAVEAAIMIIGPEVGALATGLVAAGAGVGAFAALAAPAFGKVHSAYTQIQADQQAYDRALTSKARATAMAHLRQDWASLDPAQAGAVRGVQQLVGEFHEMSKAFEPTAFKVFNEGLQVANQLLPYIGQFAQAAAPAIEHLVGGLGRFVGGGEFRYFMGFLQSLAGPVLTAVGSGMKGLGERLMIIMELFSKKDVINSVNIAFRILGFTLSLIQGLIMEGMGAWDLLIAGLHNTAAWFDRARHASADFAHNASAHFDEIRHDVATWGHDVAHVFDDFRHDVAEVGHDVAHYWDDLRHDAAEVGHDVAHAFDVMRHDIAAAVDGALNWVKAHWIMIVAWLVAPIGMAVFEIRTHTHQIAQAFDGLRHDVAAILAGARHDIAAFADWVPHVIAVAFDTTRHNTAAAVDGLRHDVAHAFDAVRHDTAAAMGWLRHEIASAFDNARHDVASATANVRHDVASAWDWLRHATATTLDEVARFFMQLPGRILSFLAGLPGEMLQVGENVILGLIHGIESAASQIPGIMRGLASDVASYFTNPLKLFSPSRLFHEYGMNIVMGAVNGIRAYAPVLQQAMHQLGSGVAAGGIPGVTAGAGGLSGGGTSRATVNITANFAPGAGGLNDPRFLQYIQTIVQEATLRYQLNNPGNGLSLSGRI